MKKYSYLIAFFLVGLAHLGLAQNRKFELVDAKATTATQALFTNLMALSGNGVLFGQQDALIYGIGWKNEYNKSDVKMVTGSHPAVFGWDLQSIATNDTARNAREYGLNLKRYCQQVAEMGGINTLSWHVQNFVTGKNFYDTTKCVSAILPGGSRHQEFVKALNQVATFIGSLKTLKGVAIPVIFRPFHEHTGNWFWWGKPFCTVAEYKALWQFTVTYLRDQKKLHNVLYAYSPDRIAGNFEEYLERYPGDEYVDVLGFDNYFELKDINDKASIDLAVSSLAQICKYAKAKNKIAALTETGQEKIVQPNWFTTIFDSIMANPDASRIAYLLVWRNAHTGHFYAPYPGHASEKDFKQFYDHPKTIFLNNMSNNFYQNPHRQLTSKTTNQLTN